jgi:multicomponent Na+:H+ antiporter subunit G
MSVLLDLLAWVSLLVGGVFIIIGAIGIHRMPDVFTRMHATSLIDTLGVAFLGLGMLLQTDEFAVAVRLAIIVLVTMTASAVATHALARAALHDGVRPLLAGSDGTLRATDCARIYPDLGVRLAQPLISEQVEESLPLPVPPDRRSLASEAEERAEEPEDGRSNS